jgi:predicted SAM-dependent methyltransferase
MLWQARELNRDFSSLEFRQLQQDRWPVETASCSLVVSLHVLQHMSTLELIEHSIGEMGRVLSVGGKAVFNVPTTRWRGHLIQCLRRPWTNLKELRRKQSLKAIEQRLAQRAAGSAVFTEKEIMHDMFQLDCRRMKSLLVSRLQAATRNSGLEICRMQRGEFGQTLVAAEKR